MRSIRSAVAPAGVALALSLFAQVPLRAGSLNSIQLLQEMAETEDYTARREKCTQAASGSPPAFVRFFCDGYDAIYRDRDEAADRYLEDTLREKPDFALACILYADAYQDRGQLDRAEQFYRRAIALQPQRSDARFSLGQLLLERGRSEPKYLPQALEEFRLLTEADPGSGVGWSNMATVLVAMNRLADAKMIIEKAIQREPDDPFLRDQAASIAARAGDDAGAASGWERALALNASYGPAVVELSALYGRQGRIAEALDLLESSRSSVVAPPWGPRIRRNLAFLLLALESPELAENLLRPSARDSDDAYTLLGLAHLSLTKADTLGGLALLERGAALDPEAAKSFVAAWRGVIAKSVAPATSPAVAKLLASGEAKGGPSGVGATRALAQQVLEGWNLTNLAAAQEALAAPKSGDRAYDVPPRVKEQVAAEYPELAQERGQEGSVTIRVSIDASGNVVDARVEKSNAASLLEDAALSAARRWRFEPATRYGIPVAATLSIPFQFRTAH